MKLVNQLKKIKNLDRSVKLFMAVTIFFGLFFSIRTLFFNFLILSQGFDKEFLGVANGMIPASTLILGLPMGMLTDRIGRKNASIFGLVIMVIGYSAMLFVTNSNLILAALFFGGSGETLLTVSRAPLLTRLTTKENRSFVYSFNYSLFILVGIVGNLIAGQMPIWFEAIFAVIPKSTASYQSVFFVGIFLIMLALIPSVLIESRRQSQHTETNNKLNNNSKNLTNLHNILRKPLIWKLFIPVLIFGLSAGLINPYFNLFFSETFGFTDQFLGTLFGAAALFTGISCLAGPWLANKFGGPVQMNVITQFGSMVFLMAIGLFPWSGVAMIGFIGQGAMMQLGIPLYTAFALDQVNDDEQGLLNSLIMLSWQTGWAIMPLVSGMIQESLGFTPLFFIAVVLLGIGNFLKWIFFIRKDPQPVLQTN